MGLEDNVVRLPRDWLGPREDLVPFGPSADAEDGALATPPSTHDFWGEPATDLWESEPDLADAPTETHRRRLMRPIRATAFSRAGVRASEHGRAAALALGVAASVAAFAFVAGGGGSGHPRLPAAAEQHAPTQTSVANLTAGRALPSLAPATHRTAAHLTSRVGHRRGRQWPKRTRHRGGRRVSRTATVQSVRYNGPSAGSSAAGTSSSSTPTSSSSAPPETSAPTSAPTGVSAAPSSGSSNQPAIGAAGMLAPGRSPDS
jgi:hypothetical protein